MALRIDKYLVDLRSQANRWRRIDINGKEDSSFASKYLRRIILSLTSILLVWILKEGFSPSFVSYSSGVLSILVGLFITALIFSFDKFYPRESDKTKSFEIGIKRKENTQNEKLYHISFENITENNSQEKLSDTQAFNYSKQFAFVTGYNIVLCVFAIIALSLTTLFENPPEANPFAENLHKYTFTFQKLNWDSILLLFKLSIVAIQRFFILYWLFSIMYNTLFIVSSMVKFMTVKIDRSNDSN